MAAIKGGHPDEAKGGKTLAHLLCLDYTMSEDWAVFWPPCKWSTDGLEGGDQDAGGFEVHLSRGVNQCTVDTFTTRGRQTPLLG